MRLGCLDHDPAIAAALPQVRYGARPLAPSVMPDLSWTPILGKNNVLPTCVAVAFANAVRASVRYLGGGDIQVPTGAIEALYARAIGMPGATEAQLAATDGSDPLVVLALAASQGWDVGLQAPLVPAYGVGDGTQASIAGTIEDVGAVMLAVTLYANDMQMQANGFPWLDPPSGAAAGRHMIAACGYSALVPEGRLTVATWGAWQQASWSWLMPRLRLVMPALVRDVLPPAAAPRYVELAAQVGAS